MKISAIILFILISVQWSYSQKERSYNRKGVNKYEAGDYSTAELDFMKALEVDSNSFAANYNTAATLYKQEKYAEANEVLTKLANNSDSQDHLPDMLHNLGNNFLKQEMYPQSIEAYKNSLRLRPEDDETRYNLSYAQAKLKQQEQESKDQDKNNDQQDKEKKDQEKKDQENKDQQEQEQEQEQEKQEQQQEQQQEEQKQEQQAAETKELSEEDVARILQAIQQQEKEVKEKVDKEKAKVKKVKTEKDW
ncbi:MAG: tetratricopeptide repeat protein [Bacteroidales bacterium]|nr:tetratricopeptide repeat protein [Bacteroidales bacterium]MCF8392102.1 tetratricopeptide repeat protein [Bacteroidales bacterium]